jgi:hypothetical protein
MDPFGHPLVDDPLAADREADLVESAIRLVASGAAARTVVAGLHDAEAAVGVLRWLASSAGVSLETIDRAGQSGRDVVVRRLPPQPAA